MTRGKQSSICKWSADGLIQEHTQEHIQEHTHKIDSVQYV